MSSETISIDPRLKIKAKEIVNAFISTTKEGIVGISKESTFIVCIIRYRQ